MLIYSIIIHIKRFFGAFDVSINQENSKSALPLPPRDRPWEKKGTHTNRIVKNLGNFDKLPEEVRNAYLDKKAKRELAKSFELKLREKDISSAVDTVAKTDAAPTRISNFNRLFPLNYGHLALKPLWEKDLGLKYKIEYLQNLQQKSRPGVLTTSCSTFVP